MTKGLEQPTSTEREILSRAKRVVVKLGTRVVMHRNGELALGRLHGIIEELVTLKRSDRQLILISSGAIGLGAGHIGVTTRTLPDRQACAAIGQVLLMSVYEQAFSRYGLKVAQLLLTEHDFNDRKHYLNLRNTFHSLFEAQVIPIVNENDPVSTDEIEFVSQRSSVFSDNDKLSALLTSRIDAEVLVLLTDVDGIYSTPGPGKGGALIEKMESIDIAAATDSGQINPHGRGGMLTKLEAAQVAADNGCAVVVANGRSPGILQKIFSAEAVGTLFLPSRKLSSRKNWIAFATYPAGRVTVAEGARKALETTGASLLFSGVLQITGNFKRGDVLTICDSDGQEFARGMSNHDSGVAQKLVGQHTKKVAELTHHSNYDAFITRDNLVLLKG